MDQDTLRNEDHTNDPIWYAQTPQLMQLAANIPFSQAAGTSFNLNVFNDESGTLEANSPDMVVPGIMTLTLIPVPSDADAATSPLNIASTSVFSFVRHANSGTPQYNAPDLMLYYIAMGQVYSYINFLQRIYGCVNLYANMNRYLPRAVVMAQGVNYDNILQNLPNFKYGIDTLIHKAASLAVPAAMTYFQRLAFLFSGLYAEGESVKDQLYMYVPAGFMQFSETSDQRGGSLNYVKFYDPNLLKSYTDLINYGNALLNPIIASEDMNIMSGDTLKAYGDTGILKLALLPDNYVVTPTTDLTVLEQFQNSTRFTSGDTQPTTCKIVQSQKGLAGSLRSVVQFTYSAEDMAMVNGMKLLTTILTAPTAADVMERTRLMAVGHQQNVDDTTEVIQAEMATEVPLSLYYFNFNPVTHEITRRYVNNVLSLRHNNSVSSLWDQLQIHCDLENFKFHPMVAYMTSIAPATNLTLSGIAIDIDNYAVISVVDLKRMNEAALLSMFNTNSVARAY